VKSQRSEVYNIVSDVLNNEITSPKWEELPAWLGLGVSWNFLWTWSKPRINMNHLIVWQRVNHFSDSKQLTRKDLLKKNLQRYADMSNKTASEFEIMPLTFLLPQEYNSFVKAFTEIQSRGKEVASTNNSDSGDINATLNMWIMKPVGLSRGRGISIVQDLAALAYSQSSVVQKYIEKPLCLGGYKFDLRLYIVVTSFKPLEAFIYKDGFARLSTKQYSLAASERDNLFIHLTNSSIQKQNASGPSQDNPLLDKQGEEDAGGSKIALLGDHGLWRRLTPFGIDVAKLWKDICVLVLKSLEVVDDKMVNQPCCFELFGYDVLIDEQLRPWLIEVNASPSLARDHAIDKRVKNAVIKDLVLLLDPAPYDRAALASILKRRLNAMAKRTTAPPKNDAELEKDLRDILGSHVPRSFGEIPKIMGGYEMLCPNTKMHEHVLKLKRKIFKT
jgi:tubulin polyglutamylase TTLL5